MMPTNKEKDKVLRDISASILEGLKKRGYFVESVGLGYNEGMVKCQRDGKDYYFYWG